jgi:hypothetical protein
VPPAHPCCLQLALLLSCKHYHQPSTGGRTNRTRGRASSAR